MRKIGRGRKKLDKLQNMQDIPQSSCGEETKAASNAEPAPEYFTYGESQAVGP